MFYVMSNNNEYNMYSKFEKNLNKDLKYIFVLQDLYNQVRKLIDNNKL